MKAFIRILSALIAVAAAIPTNSYTPPSDMPGGAYFVNFNGAGNAVTTRADTGEIVTQELAAPSSLEQRDEPTTAFNCDEGCPSSCTGFGLNANDYSTVQRCMDNFLDLCNYVNTNYGGTSEINTFNGIMDSQCGRYRSGWVFIKDWQKTYWRTDWGENICGNAGGPEKRHDVTPDYS